MTEGPDPMTDTDELERLARAAIADNDNPCIFAATQSLDTFNHAANPATILALLSANREMREALEWYGDPISYVVTQDNEPRSAVHGDGGRKARSALTTQRGE